MLLVFGPGAWGELGDLPVGGVGESGEDISEVGVGVDMVTTTGFYQCVEDGAAVTCISIAEKEPVFLSNGCGADGVFDEVVVDLNLSVTEVDAEQCPVGEGVIDSHAHGTPRKVMAGGLESDQSPVDALVDDTAVAGADDGSLGGVGVLPPQSCFDVVEVGDLTEKPTGSYRCLLLGFKEASPGMGPASSQCDLTSLFRKAGVGGIGVALEGAMEVFRYDLVQTFCCPAGVPGKDGVSTG